MKRTILMSIVALAISVAFVSGVMAQQKPAPTQTGSAQKARWEKIRGVIEKVDEASKEVFVESPKEKMAFSIGEHTTITDAVTIQKMPFAALKKGMWATVEYGKEGKKLVAEWINVHMAKAEAKQVTSAEAKEGKSF